ncbi:MAG: DEAD/DEAH box helicase [Paludibacteraceae bacterium]|jgi:superfamily II DNA/RNA helicase|nr:DEAD/DEAH box helicase [Paludibacteraceae bacterium]
MKERISNALKALNIEKLNEMQEMSLRANESGRNVLLLSPTGSGKTLAFLLPLLRQLKVDANESQALVLAPSRELALQIEQVFKGMNSPFHCACCYGGHSIEMEARNLSNKPQLIIGTPGRILDHIRRENIVPQSILFLTIDEFDKSLELGFQDEMEEIIKHLTSIKKKMLLSATRSEEIPDFVKLHHPIVLDFLKEEEIKESGLTLYRVNSPQKDKLDSLLLLIKNLDGESTLVFCNYRESAERIFNFLKKNGADCKVYHGGMEQIEREKSLFQFRNKSINILISTDLAARGLDITDVKHIIHYHIPVNQEAYTHRNGRTARMFASGNAYLLLHAEEKLPDYIANSDLQPFTLEGEKRNIAPSEWSTLYIGKGKKNKISKGDLVGFFIKKGELEKEDIGMIEVKENFSFASIKRTKIVSLIKKIKDEKIKGIKTIFEIAK